MEAHGTGRPPLSVPVRVLAGSRGDTASARWASPAGRSVRVCTTSPALDALWWVMMSGYRPGHCPQRGLGDASGFSSRCQVQAHPHGPQGTLKEVGGPAGDLRLQGRLGQATRRRSAGGGQRAEARGPEGHSRLVGGASLGPRIATAF